MLLKFQYECNHDTILSSVKMYAKTEGQPDPALRNRKLTKNTNIKIDWQYKSKLDKVAIIAMYWHLRPPDAITFPT